MKRFASITIGIALVSGMLIRPSHAAEKIADAITLQAGDHSMTTLAERNKAS